MYRGYNMVEGEPPRIYKTPDEIRREMQLINGRISETNERLNIRDLLSEMLVACTEKDTKSCIEELEEMIGEARDSLDELGRLRDSLLMLAEELEETRCEIGY